MPTVPPLVRHPAPLFSAARFLIAISVFTAVFALLGHGQDAPSVAEAARQAREQKLHQQAQPQQTQKEDQAREGEGQTKETSGDAADKPTKTLAATKAPRIITNDEIPERPISSITAASQNSGKSDSHPAYESKLPADAWKAQILGVKNSINWMQSDIDRLNGTIRFASGSCVANCVQWNERQRQKQQQVEQMNAQLADQRKRLEDMQESARQQGYGSSVYDP